MFDAQNIVNGYLTYVQVIFLNNIFVHLGLKAPFEIIENYMHLNI